MMDTWWTQGSLRLPGITCVPSSTAPFLHIHQFCLQTPFCLTTVGINNTKDQLQFSPGTDQFSNIFQSPPNTAQQKASSAAAPKNPLRCVLAPMHGPPLPPRGIGMAIGGMHYWGSAASGLHGAAAAHLTLPRAPLSPNPCTPIPLHTSSLKSTFLSKIPPNLVKLLQSIMTLLMVIGMCNTNYPCQI